MDGKDHPLSLKVMRLSQPTLFTGISVSCDSRDLPGDIFLKEAQNDMAIPYPDAGVGQVLLLPQSFGNIYLGETFSCCVCIHNHSSELFESSLKTVLQMNNQCITLFESSGDEGSQLQPDGLISKIVHHEVKEIGTHILVCGVNYKNPNSGIESSFRKFFKFQVMKPLDVKTKFYNAESDDVYLEAGIQNITAGPMFLEKVSLEPSPYYSVTSLNDLIGAKSCDSVFGPVGVLNQADVRQYLFCLRPNRDTTKRFYDESGAKQAANIGKLDIVWRTNMGGKGRLQTSQLQRMILPSQYNDVKLSIEKLPKNVFVEQPLDIEFRIVNVSERSISLLVDFLPGGGGTEWHCFNSRHLEALEPRASVTLSAWLMPLKLGLQTIAGIRLTDTFLKRNYDYESLAQVFVQQS